MTAVNVEQPKLAQQKYQFNDEDFVIASVLSELGRPKDLYRVDAEKLWNNQYRVNVYCRTELERPFNAVRMTDSFFVTRTESGISSRPTIVRKYM